MKEHAAEVARFKAAKEQAEAIQVELRKEKEAEIERIRTQYMFKVRHSYKLYFA